MITKRLRKVSLFLMPLSMVLAILLVKNGFQLSPAKENVNSLLSKDFGVEQVKPTLGGFLEKTIPQNSVGREGGVPTAANATHIFVALAMPDESPLFCQKPSSTKEDHG